LTAVPGDVIIWQGAPGDLFYILESGGAEVLKNNSRVGTIEKEKAFGELALMNSAVRAATIRIITPSKLWTLDRKTFRSALAMNEARQRQRRIEILRGIKMFEKLTDSSLGQIADVLQQTAYAPGQRIVKQGDAGDAFYILERGTVSVTQSSLTGGTTEITRLDAISAFGELALISKQPRAANVTAVDSVSCLKMDVAVFNSVLGTLDQVQREDAGLQILKKVELLSGLSDKQLVTIARFLRSETYSEGVEIITQGEYGDDFFMIASGEVSVRVNNVEVAKLGAGSYFGEMSLMNKERRNATVVALGAPSGADENRANQTSCLLLSRSDVSKIVYSFTCFII
jgi:CRP-like cAMP-binding protein